MPRLANNSSLDQIILSAMAPVIERASGAIAKAVAAIAAEQLEAELRRSVNGAGTRPAGRRRTAVPRTQRAARSEITKWVADRRARRVPNFVIEATGLKTKKAIVAKYGEDAVFEKGKAVPKAQ